jgi:cysteine-rich repeat protein
MPEAGEFCDDGDLSPGDGCDAQCRPEGQRLGERTETREIVVTTAPSTPDQRLCDSDSVAIGLEGGGGRSTYLPNLGLHCQALDGSLRPVDEPYKTGMVGDKNPYAGADCPEGMVLVGVTINYRYEGNVIGAEGNCLSAAVVYGATEPRLRTTDTDWLGWRSGPTTPYLSCPPGAAVTGIIGAVSDTTGEGSAYRLQCRALDGQP